jgi:polysaccharide biosynthesis protein PslH
MRAGRAGCRQPVRLRTGGGTLQLPVAARPPPFEGQAKSLVFTGAMDYWANVDAVTWFASEIWPQVRSAVPGAEFWIVGARPHPRVRDLDNREGIRVTGTVPDVRPYLQHARAVIAPMRIARGIQNKVLEAMAMDKPVIGTSAAFEGIATHNNASLSTENDPQGLAATCSRALLASGCEHGRTRAEAQKFHAWDAKLARLDALLEA